MREWALAGCVVVAAVLLLKATGLLLVSWWAFLLVPLGLGCLAAIVLGVLCLYVVHFKQRRWQ